jgi:actin-related protein 6
MSKAKKKLVDSKPLLGLQGVGEQGGSGTRTLVLDNGAGRIKYGWSSDEQPRCMPNALAKIHKTLESVVGDEIDSVPGATSQLRFSRPFDRGYLVNWGVERDIWHRMLTSNLDAHPAECDLVLTVPPFCPEEIQQDTNEMLFEEMEFASVVCRPAAWFSSYHYSQGGASVGDDQSDCFKECNVVVDSGFSFTHAIPFVNGIVRGRAAKRVNVGGKLLTNYLKEIISYRQWNFMDEFLLVNQVKDALCYVSQDFSADLSRCKLESPNMRISQPGVYRDDRNDSCNYKAIREMRQRKGSSDDMVIDNDNEEEKGEEWDNDDNDNGGLIYYWF